MKYSVLILYFSVSDIHLERNSSSDGPHFSYQQATRGAMNCVSPVSTWTEGTPSFTDSSSSAEGFYIFFNIILNSYYFKNNDTEKCDEKKL